MSVHVVRPARRRIAQVSGALAAAVVGLGVVSHLQAQIEPQAGSRCALIQPGSPDRGATCIGYGCTAVGDSCPGIFFNTQTTFSKAVEQPYQGCVPDSGDDGCNLPVNGGSQVCLVRYNFTSLPKCIGDDPTCSYTIESPRCL